MQQTVSHVTEVLSPEQLTPERVQQLQRAQLIGRLTAGVAHDFNNILTTIVGYADLILSESSIEVGEQVRRDVGEIRSAAQRAAALTRQILSFTRGGTVGSEIVDAPAVIGEMSTMLGRLLADDVTLAIEHDSCPLPVMLDATRLEQVVMNLVVNARDAMPAGGRIDIESKAIAVDAEFAAAHRGLRPGPYVVIEVADTGVGMPEHVRERIFEPFFTTKTPGRGTGLGLSIVSGIVRDAGGHIIVQSAANVGTRISVFLPAQRASVVPPALPCHERRALNGRETLILVEDDPQVRSLASLWLRRYGYVVHEAATGEEAVRRVIREDLRPDLLVTDLSLPKTGGEMLAGTLRSVLPELKVLYMSGYAPDVEGNDARLAPGRDFLQKPFSPRQLLNDVRRLAKWDGPERRQTPFASSIGGDVR